MKKDLHPDDYRLVVFEDLNNGTRILTKSTAKTTDTVKWEDGNEYPLVKVHISSSSHPFFTGQEKLVDVEGRVDRFKAHQQAANKAREAKIAASKTTKKPKK
jgi:large subunit ribosomal protein L31